MSQSKHTMDGIIDLTAPFTVIRKVSKNHPHFFALNGDYQLFFHDISNYQMLITNRSDRLFLGRPTHRFFGFNLITAKDEDLFGFPF